MANRTRIAPHRLLRGHHPRDPHGPRGNGCRVARHRRRTHASHTRSSVSPQGDHMLSRRGFITGAAAVAVTGATASLAACGKKATSGSSGAGGTKTITLGFSQVGSESGWRSANTDSIKSAAKDAGINLKFSDAQQKQENQIQAIRDYISQKVDVISFSPVVTTGWDTVLKEAQAAKIPVILTDQQVDSDPSLFVTLVGSDFEAEGERAAALLDKVLKLGTPPAAVNIAVLEGTTGSAPAIERAK